MGQYKNNKEVKERETESSSLSVVQFLLQCDSWFAMTQWKKSLLQTFLHLSKQMKTIRNINKSILLVVAAAAAMVVVLQ